MTSRSVVLRILATSALLLVPCVWQEHIQAGDLSSHLYNAWLAGEIRHGNAPGLELVSPFTNVLGDWTLDVLLNLVGMVATERIVCGAAALNFFWGAFVLIRVASFSTPWRMSPILAMIAYGLIFHLGLLNYYISTGLCFWLLALLWNPSRRRLLLALAIAVLAALAHVVPVAWALGIAGYVWIARTIRPEWRPWLPSGVLGLMLLGSALVWMRVPARWSWNTISGWNGILGVTGAEQVWLFGGKYIVIALALLGLWCWRFFARLDQGELQTDPIAQLWVLHLIGFVVLPSAIQPEHYAHVLAYIPQRVSLFGAVVLCIVIGRSFASRAAVGAALALAAVYFSFLYVDVKAYNTAEREISALLVNIHPGQRVVASLEDSRSRLSPLMHAIDRACIGHCWSFGNYEPSTRQFRIRAPGPNPVVEWNAVAIGQMERGGYAITGDQAPITAVCTCASGPQRFCLRTLQAGDVLCHLELPVSPPLFTSSAPPRL